MAQRGVIIAAALAALVCGAVYLTATRGRAPAGAGAGGGATPLDVDPTSIVEITVDDSRGVLTMSASSRGGWATKPAVEGAASWPVDAARLRLALRALADADLAEAQPGPPPADAATISLRRAAGEPISLVVDAARLGGRARAWTGERAYTMDGAVADLWTSPGPWGWRDAGAIPGVGAETTRLSVVSAEGTFTLARLRGVWRVIAPGGARADDAAVQAMISALGKITVSRFDEPAPADAAFAPVITITAEAESRLPAAEGVASTRRTRSLALGAPKDPKQTPATPDGGKTWLVVNAESLAEAPLSLDAIVSRTAAETLPANVGMVQATPAASIGGPERGWRRGLDGWESLRDDGAREPISDEPVLEILELLTSRIAAEVRLADAASEFETLYTIRLLGFADEPLETFEIGRVPLVAGWDLAVRSHSAGVSGPGERRPGALRIYPGADLPALLAP